MKNRTISILIALALAVIIALAMYFIFATTPVGGALNRIALLFGGSFFPWGWIQALTFFLFFFALQEVLAMKRIYSKEHKALQMGFLPEKENWVLSPQDVMDLKLKVIEKEQNGKFFLTELIKKACNKYRSGKSTSEALEVVTTSVRINLTRCESAQSIIRYVIWAIPSVGFIGTVIGIAASLGIADQAATPQGISAITGMLNVAFDTTLVSLLLSLVLMLFYHRMTEKVEQYHSDVEQYVIENLINRIYHS